MVENVVDTLEEVEASSISSSSLRHLERFYKTLTRSDFSMVTGFFLKGGWTEIIEQFFYESPNREDGEAYSPTLIFPGSELSAHRIDPIPLVYPSSKELRLGDMILKTAWIRGFSPRLYFYYPSKKENPSLEESCNTENLGEQITIVRFVERSEYMPLPLQAAPGIEALDQSLLPHNVAKHIAINTTKDSSRGQKLEEFMEETVPKFGTAIHYDTKPELKQQLIQMKFCSASLAEILDAVAYCLDATWDWVDEKTIYIAPGPGYGTSVTACIGGGSCS